jgi:hypothetical protein
VSLKKHKSQDKAVEVTVNSKEENSEDFCMDFVQEFGLWTGNAQEDDLLILEGGRGADVEPNHTAARKLVPFYNVQCSLI